jgi:predicted O-linked N-acetylglucosamine transferase (SPINDLY family)
MEMTTVQLLAETHADQAIVQGPAAGTGVQLEPERAALVARAASGQLGLPELLDTATRWTSEGRTDAAVALYGAWCANEQTSHRYVVLFNMGALLSSIGKHAESQAAYEAALQIKPDFVQAKVNLAHQRESQGDSVGAVGHWREALDLLANVEGEEGRSLRIHTLNSLARVLEILKRYDESEACMVQSLQIDPNQPKVIQHYVHIRQKQCEWPVYQGVGEVTPNQLLMGTSPLAMLSASDDPALQLLAARGFAHDRVKPVAARPLAFARRQRPGPLRVGYLSGDLCMHAVGLLMAETLELHDRSRVEVFGFCWSREDGTPLRARLVKGFDHLIRIGNMSDEAAARLIASCDIDVLVDLQGITSGARADILSHRPGRVQITYLGFPATSGLPSIDYVLCDRFVVPPALMPYMTEKPLYMPNCYQASDRQRDVGETPRRADYGLPDDKFVYCSFNNNFKFTEGLFACWMRVLKAVDNSVLWLLADNPWAQANMLRVAAEHGIDPSRLIFAPRVAPPDYLARFQLADLFLDTFPYNAGTTANDVLWMGTPILTLSGRTFISRMAGSLLTNVGLPDLITESQDEYERKAIRLGQQPQMVQTYKRYLSEHRMQSPLFDMPGFVRDLESAYASVAVI